MSLHNVRSKIVRDRGHFRDQNYEMGGNRVKLGVILDFCHCKDKTHIHLIYRWRECLATKKGFWKNTRSPHTPINTQGTVLTPFAKSRMILGKFRIL